MEFFVAEIYKCECGKAYSKERSLYLHKHLDCGKKLLRCTKDDCDATFKRKHSLKNHLIAVHQIDVTRVPGFRPRKP